jgi:hypothetical protein
VLINNRFFGSPDYMKMGIETVTLHLAAMCHCEHIESKGKLSKKYLKDVFKLAFWPKWKISQKEALKRLTEAGWWIDQGDHYCIPETGMYKYSRACGTPLQRKRSQFRGMYRKAFNYLLSNFTYECAYCGSTQQIEVDHIKPLSKGGTNDLDNLQFLCKKCNTKKGAKYGE